VETGALFRVLQPWLEASVGAAWKERVLFVTDPRSGVLRALADESGLRSLPVPPDVGGRFSVQTAVGLLPAAFLGIDVDALLDGAEAMRERVRDPDAARNPAFSFASLHDAFWGHANVTVWMAYCDALRGIGEWFQQLWAESLGKHLPQGAGHYGWTPAVAQGPVDQHSQLQLYQEGPRDKIVTFVAVDEPGTDVALPALRGPAERLASYLAGRSLATLMEAERLGTMAALVDAGRPVVELRVPRVDESVIGALFVLLEQATAMAGLLRGVDPFDQPGVEFGKRFASGLLGRPEYAADAAKARALLGLPEDAGSRAAS
jgi:glucose-6-phosphate isomerase